MEWQPIPSPGELPDLGIEVGSPALQVDSQPAELPGKPKIMEWQPIAFPGELPDLGIEVGSPALQVDS